jgi:hypothetical protein
VVLVGEAVAMVKSVPVEDVIASTVAATRAVFKIG